VSDEIQGQAAPVEAAVNSGGPSEAPSQDKIAASMEKVYHDISRTESADEMNAPPAQPKQPRAPNGQFGRRDHSLKDFVDDGNENTAASDDLEKPQAWGKKVVEHWNSLPPEVQQEILKRETDIQRGLGDAAERLKKAEASSEELGQILSRHANAIPRLPDGREMPVPQVLDHLLAAHQMLETNPRQALAWLHDYYGVNPAELIQHDPIEEARQQERAAIEHELQQQHQQQRALREQQMIDHIEQFAADKPYWDDIEDDISYHLIALKETMPHATGEQILQLAHDKALAGHPDLDPKAKEKAQNDLLESRRKADEAKKLASMNVGSRHIGATPVVRRSLEEDMAAVYERLHGRG
jgi:hypothetical protein